MKKSLAYCGLALALSGAAGCSGTANQVKSFRSQTPLAAKNSIPVSPSITFNSDVEKLENDLKQIDYKLSELESARAAIYLKAAIAKLMRLDKGFDISSTMATKGLNAAASDLESGRAKEAGRSIQKIIADLDALRKQHEGKISAEVENLLDKMKKMQETPRFLRRMVSGKIKRLAGDIDTALSSLMMLKSERGLMIGASDARALKMIEANLGDMRKSASSIRAQLDEVRGMEIAKAEKSAAESLKVLETSANTPEDFAKRAIASANLKAALKQLDRLKRQDGDKR